MPPKNLPEKQTRQTYDFVVIIRDTFGYAMARVCDLRARLSIFVIETMARVKKSFFSAPYFELLKQHLEWYEYVTVGYQVIFVVNGVAYGMTL